MDKIYHPRQIEGRIYALWDKSGYFNPDNLPGERKKKFSMVLPPPNVTGTLHIGHALTVTIEDIIVRYKRMRGEKTLWVPGTDHASIATETKFLKEKKISRNDYANKRDEFIKLVNEYALQNQEVIIKQLRAMGASLDWSRLAFTLDEKRKNAVYTAFTRMYDAGLIYHGEYLVNWDPKGQTTVSDDEIEYETTQDKLYTFRYSKGFPIPIATTRPETKLGDVAVAVHPNGKWKQYISKKIKVENFAGVKLHIEIIGDEVIDPTFGTGAVGITPAHSKVDGEIARRHNLPSKQVINEAEKIIQTGTDWDGKVGIIEAREKIIEWLKKEKLLEKMETIEHNIAKAQRSGGIIEILPKRHQFFIDVNKRISERGEKTLKDLMREAVASGKIKIIPERFEKIYFNWIDNLHDWNISRQVWYGHKIPAWYKGDEVAITEKPLGGGWNEINDTFDTWFSSGLWTFSSLGWPEDMKDLRIYHPTDLLETGYDIIFFWVARMILMSTFLLNDVPFHKVFLHGLVRDERRRKMSKSLGNVIDPLDMTEKYGTDALRMALIFNTAPGTDLAISEEKIKGMRNFTNKIWNIARFYEMKSQEFKVQSAKCKATIKNSKLDETDKNFLRKLDVVKKSISKQIETFRFDRAADMLYHFIWHEFADKYLEEVKKSNDSQKFCILHFAFCILLKLLHPFMPFVTEAVWQELCKAQSAKCKVQNLLMVEKWPNVSDKVIMQ